MQRSAFIYYNSSLDNILKSPAEMLFVNKSPDKGVSPIALIVLTC